MLDNDLPDHWVQSQLGDIIDVLDSQRVPVNRDEREKRAGEIPYFGATGQVGWIDGHLFDEELVLLGEDGAPFFDKTKNVAYMVRGKSWVNNHAHVLRAREGVLNSYLLHHLNWSDYRPFVSGTTRHKLPQSPMRKIPIRLCPSAEQDRIVAEIEKQFSRLDAGVAALRRVEANLKRYKAAVLKAACTGALTAEWRADHPDVEPASKLLERILRERRRQWEETELAKMIAKGKPPKDDKWKAKYEEPVAPKSNDLPGLPETWCWGTLDQLILLGDYGTSIKCGYEAPGVPVLRIPNIVKQRIDTVDMKYATGAILGWPESKLACGDILVCRTNGSIDLLGKTAVFPAELREDYAFASYLIRLRLAVSEVVPRFVHHVLGSVWGRHLIESDASSSAGQHNLSLSKICRFPCPIPPLEEMKHILEMVEGSLSLVDAAEVALYANSARANRLRQSILKTAFEGKLVEQDPSDEPASVLLERIRAERAKMEADKPKARRGRASAASMKKRSSSRRTRSRA